MIALAYLLTGCGALFHQDAIRLCRSLIPLFNGPSDTVDVRRADAARTPHGLLVTVAYVVTASAPASRRAVSCIFREDGPAGRLDLTNLATEDGPVGDVRLYMIKRNWIDKGHASVNDPAPIALSGIIPDIPRAVAGPLQILLTSLSGLGIYAVLAAAYALIYGLLGRIHLAFGDLAMLAGYGACLGFWIAGGATVTMFGMLGALLIGMATSVVHGAALGKFIFDRLIARPGQHILLATLGLSIAWSELARLSQGTGLRWIPPLLNQPIGIARADDYIVTITPMHIAVPLIATLAIFTCLTLMRTSRFGRHWRAVADDPFAASLLGVSRTRVLGQTMILASALAGLGGVLTLMSYGGVGHAGGLVVGLKALIAAVIGGIGSVRGAVLGALTVGLAEAAWSYAVSIESRDLAIFCGLTLVLVLKPGGLFARP